MSHIIFSIPALDLHAFILQEGLSEIRHHQMQNMAECFCAAFPSLERQESVATTEARLRMEGVELKEEWQDEDFPRYCVNHLCCQLWVDHGLCFVLHVCVLKAT